jgi:hypothetical protein
MVNHFKVKHKISSKRAPGGLVSTVFPCQNEDEAEEDLEADHGDDNMPVEEDDGEDLFGDNMEE